MITRWADSPGACDAIEAEFVFGPVLCGRQTNYTTEIDGETFHVCEQHVASGNPDAAPQARPMEEQ